MAISLEGVIRFTVCLVLWWGFPGRRIEWCYFRFDQIQDGSSAAAVFENSNGNFSSTNYQIHSMFSYKVLFLGWRIEWRYFTIVQIQ